MEAKPREEIWKGNSGKTDSNGTLILPVYRIPVGKILRLDEVVIWADGYTPASPLASTATKWLAMYRDNNCINPPFDFLPKARAVLIPAVAEYRKMRFHSNECITLKTYGFTEGVNITVVVGGYLEAESGKKEKVTTNA